MIEATINTVMSPPPLSPLMLRVFTFLPKGLYLLGGKTQMTKKESLMHLLTMDAIAQAMFKKNNWNKGMHKDLKKIINKF